MTNGANASYVNVDFATDVLYMLINSHVTCKMEYEVSCSSREYMTLCPNEREAFIWMDFSSFNCNLFSIIQYLTSEMHVSTEEIAL